MTTVQIVHTASGTAHERDSAGRPTTVSSIELNQGTGALYVIHGTDPANAGGTWIGQSHWNLPLLDAGSINELLELAAPYAQKLLNAGWNDFTALDADADEAITKLVDAEVWEAETDAYLDGADDAANDLMLAWGDAVAKKFNASDTSAELGVTVYADGYSLNFSLTDSSNLALENVMYICPDGGPLAIADAQAAFDSAVEELPETIAFYRD